MPWPCWRGLAPCLPSEAISSRRLALEDESGRYRFIFVKPADVPVYVEHGIADCGVVGRDVLLESGTDLLQPVTLGIGRCRIVVAALAGVSLASFGMLRVATKYPRIAAAHFGARGGQLRSSSFPVRWSWRQGLDSPTASSIWFRAVGR